MKRLTQTLPVFLAAALQLMPLVRNLFINPATGNTFAFILRWGIGSGVAVGAVDAVSGATAAAFTSTNHYYMTAGTSFSNNAVGWLGSSGQADSTVDYFSLTANGTALSPITNKQIVTATMPLGLSFRALWTNNSDTVYGVISGTPSVAGTFTNLVQFFSPGNGSIAMTITFTISNSLASLPVITNQPASLTNNVSSNATFTVTAGTAPLHYQWYFNTNTALLNATNTSLTLTNIQLTNAGYYRCTITNSAGITNSANALLTVWQPPVITNAPVGFTNVAGGSGSLGVIAGGFPALAYQWRITTNLITTSLASGTNAALTFTNLRACQAGAYTVILTNSAGSVTSTIANVVVTNPAPPMAGGSVQPGSQFQFTFTPVAGLTNSVLTNGLLAGGNWGVLTNYPPTAAPTPITLTNNLGTGSLFYRLLVVP